MNRILLAGLPRSGTTWAERAMQKALRTATVTEPDNEDNFAYAIKAKASLGRYPILSPGDDPPAEYLRLWEGAFRGGRQSPSPPALAGTLLHRLAKQHTSVHTAEGWSPRRRRMLATGVALSRPGAPARADHVVVKTVFASLALRWLRERWHPRLVVISRGPLNTVASWQRLGWPRPFDGHPVLDGPQARDVLAELAPGYDLPPVPVATDQLGRLTWELCALTAVIRRSASEEPDAVLVRHEDLCVDPVGGFRQLFADLGLGWTPAVEGFLAASNREGSGTYDTTRVAAEEPSRWRTTLSDADAARVLDTTAEFGLAW